MGPNCYKELFPNTLMCYIKGVYMEEFMEINNTIFNACVLY